MLISFIYIYFFSYRSKLVILVVERKEESYFISKTKSEKKTTWNFSFSSLFFKKYIILIFFLNLKDEKNFFIIEIDLRFIKKHK